MIKVDRDPAPGGKVEPGETDETALARELYEETGLAIVLAWVVYRGYYNTFAVTIYRVVARGEPMAREPGARVVWVSAKDLAQGFAAELHEHGLRVAGLLDDVDLAREPNVR